MEELSTEEKAKRYDEAVKKLKVLYNDWVTTQNRAAKEVEEIFPELKESEDEKIRKEIMDFIDTNTIDSDERRDRWFSYLEKHKPISFTSLEDRKVKMSLMQYISELNQDVVHLHPGIETCNEWIAWLEKQGEQKPAWSEEDKKYENIIVSILYNPNSEGIYNFHEVKCKDVINWLKSLKDKVNKPVSEELEEAVNAYIGYAPDIDECSSVYGKRQAFKAGAKWKEKEMQSTIELAEDHAMLAGMEKMKENMMAKAIDAEVLENYDGKVIKYDETILDEKLSDCKVFDKVKVIIIKE